MTKETIVIFDFDGTITTKDTMLELAKWHFGTLKFYAGLLKILPQLLMYKARIISNTKAKESFLKHFYGGMDYEYFKNLCRQYSAQEIDKILKNEAVAKIKFYKNSGFKMVVITASVADWVRPWAEVNGFEDVLGSDAEVVAGKVTGKLKGKNCHGAEKVNRFVEKYGAIENYYSIGFGDSSGDREILLKVDQPYYRKYE